MCTIQYGFIAPHAMVVNRIFVPYSTAIMFSGLASCSSRREARRSARREAILDVAQASFLERGYAGTTMSGIAAALGGSKGTLWSYFPCKEVLFAAVLDRASQAFQQQLSLILTPNDELGKTLIRFARELLFKITSPEAAALYRLVIGEAHRFPEIGRIFYDRAPRRTRDLLAQYLADAMARGLLRREEPQTAAQHLLGLCVLGLQQQVLLGLIAVDPQMIAHEAETSVAAFLRAYAP